MSERSEFGLLFDPVVLRCSARSTARTSRTQSNSSNSNSNSNGNGNGNGNGKGNGNGNGNGRISQLLPRHCPQPDPHQIRQHRPGRVSKRAKQRPHRRQ